jgi:hypothetical protein
MGGVVKSLIGGSKSKSTTSSMPQVIPANPFNIQTGSGGISATPAGATVTLYPYARNLYREGAGVLRDYGSVFRPAFDTATGLITEDIGRMRSAENPFIQARVRPLEQQIATGRGQLQRGLSQRGVFGSLGATEMANYDLRTQAQLGDARAQATVEALNAELASINQLVTTATGRAELERGLAESFATMGDSELRYTLAEMGLGQEAINAIIQDRRVETQKQSTIKEKSSKGILSALPGVGSILGTIGGIFSPAPK